MKSQPARVEFKVQFSPARKLAPRISVASPPAEPAPTQKPRGRRWGLVPTGRSSRVALLLALAHHWERLAQKGVVRDYAEIARLAGLTRARVSQIMNLMLLSPQLQEDILFPVARDTMSYFTGERSVRWLINTSIWTTQRQLWQRCRSPENARPSH